MGGHHGLNGTHKMYILHINTFKASDISLYADRLVLTAPWSACMTPVVRLGCSSCFACTIRADRA